MNIKMNEKVLTPLQIYYMMYRFFKIKLLKMHNISNLTSPEHWTLARADGHSFAGALHVELKHKLYIHSWLFWQSSPIAFKLVLDDSARQLVFDGPTTPKYPLFGLIFALLAFQQSN